MHIEINQYTAAQIKKALAATVTTAIAMWELKNWSSYFSTRNVLLALIRSGRGDEVTTPQMQFIYFITTHLQPYWGYPTSDRKMFESPLPNQHTVHDRHWETATRGEFWLLVL